MRLANGTIVDDEKPNMLPDDDVYSSEELDGQVDAVTGASPGTAQACSDLGFNSLEENLIKFNIKPPGVS